MALNRIGVPNPIRDVIGIIVLDRIERYRDLPEGSKKTKLKCIADDASAGPMSMAGPHHMFRTKRKGGQ